MIEVTEFWGVVDRELLGATRPFRWRRKDPEAGVFEYYPVFTSRGDAEVFVHAAGNPSAYDVAVGSQGEELHTESLPLRQMIEDIRRLERGEIPPDHRVLRDPIYGQDGPDFVTWGELLEEGE
jgi:hypothetical protein